MDRSHVRNDMAVLGEEGLVERLKKRIAIWLIVLTAMSFMGLSCVGISRDAPDAAGSDDACVNSQTMVSFSSAPTSYNRVDLDLNSGDFLYYEGFSDPSGRIGVCESDLSKEVRRLGIPVPRTRNWQLMWKKTESPGLHVMYAYPEVVRSANRLVGLLDKVNAPDDERRSILEEFMVILRTEAPRRARERADLLYMETAVKYDFPQIFSSAYEAHLRELR